MDGHSFCVDQTLSGISPASATALSGVIRRVVAARVNDPHDVEDLVQETLVKVAAAERRLGPDALQGYAIVTARNLIIGRARHDGTHRRHVHRLVDYIGLDGPEELTLQREETDALATALTRLDATDRALLLAHEVDGIDTAALSDTHDTTPGAIAVRLARARARLRVEFLLAFRGITLPTPRCRSVLLALSSGDTRRQRSLRAGDHLLTCSTCASLSAPLVERRRSIAGFIPFLFINPVKALGRVARNGKVQIVAGVTTVAVGTIAVIALTQPSARPRPASPTTTVAATSPVMSEKRSLLPIPTQGLTPFIGRPVRARAALVLAVRADEGAWIGSDKSARIWVQFDGSGESPFHLRSGQHITFTGRLVPTTPGFVLRAGIPEPDRAVVLAQGAHISAHTSTVTVS